MRDAVIVDAVRTPIGKGRPTGSLSPVNEAFASVVLAWQRETGVSLDKVNVHGGAIAIGHPSSWNASNLAGRQIGAS